MAGSSIVEGTLYLSPSAILRMVPRRIFPDLVFGNRSTTTIFKAAMTPECSRTIQPNQVGSASWSQGTSGFGKDLQPGLHLVHGRRRHPLPHQPQQLAQHPIGELDLLREGEAAPRRRGLQRPLLVVGLHAGA